MIDLLEIILSILAFYFVCKEALKGERRPIKEDLSIIKKEFENIWDIPKKSQMENQNLLKSIQINYHGIDNDTIQKKIKISEIKAFYEGNHLYFKLPSYEVFKVSYITKVIIFESNKVLKTSSEIETYFAQLL
ncbi:hypothetical protein [Acinetobacter sp. HY1485]|uniref:hypothetical protein n=1 Tax=Acinetobacter sp. HY1485 TaxID=2970918 RepID=UPI0022B9686A|nr:hypothetical protein [Acinetobacter sp. HY1485]